MDTAPIGHHALMILSFNFMDHVHMWTPAWSALWVHLVRTHTLPHHAAPSAPQVWCAFGSLWQLRHVAASPWCANAFLLLKRAASAATEIGAASLAPPQLCRGMHWLRTKRTHICQRKTFQQDGWGISIHVHCSDLGSNQNKIMRVHRK
jgi:hypothetical protein